MGGECVVDKEFKVIMTEKHIEELKHWLFINQICDQLYPEGNPSQKLSAVMLLAWDTDMDTIDFNHVKLKEKL